MKIYPNLVKPLCDRLIGLVGIVVSLPVLVLVLILVRLESPGSPLFLQRRVGKGLKLFPIYKIRTMVVSAAQSGPFFTSQGDPRITRVGKVLRRTSLDELPQFLNLLFGQMSLIGPRPDLPVQESQYPSREAWERRHQVHPGITGLAQTKFRSSATPEQRLSADLYYVENCSLLLDLRILYRTVQAVLQARNTN